MTGKSCLSSEGQYQFSESLVGRPTAASCFVFLRPDLARSHGSLRPGELYPDLNGMRGKIGGSETDKLRA